MTSAPSLLRPRTFIAAALAVFGISAACTEGRLPTDPTGIRPTRVSLSLNATVVGSAGRSIKVVASYRRVGASSTAILMDSAVVNLTGTETQLPIKLDVAPCLADPAREIPPGLTADNAAQTCILYLVLSLFDANNKLIDQASIDGVVATAGGEATAPNVVLGSAVGKVTVNPKTITYNAIGFSSTLNSAVTDAAGQPLVGAALTYFSQTPTIASVDVNTGQVTARAVGTTRIIVQSRDKADTATVTVRQILKSLTLSGATTPMIQGDSILVSAAAVDSNNTAIPIGGVTPLTFSSSNTSVLQVNAATGRVKAVGTGTAQVIVTSGTVTASATITVNPVAVSKVVVSPPTSNATLGTTVQFSAATQDAAGNTLTGRPVTWASSDNNIATVDANGLATTKAVGTATITAASGTISGTATLTVTQVAAASVVVAPTTASIFLSQKTTLRATVLGPAGDTLAGRPVTWTSSDNSIATVDAQGVVTAVNSGTATITATSGTAKGTATITVFNTVLALVTQPGNATTGQPLSPQPVVRMVDPLGNTVTTFQGQVRVALSGSNGSLSGTTAVNAVNGVATFSNLAITGTGNFNLVFSSDVTASLTSNNITIGSSPPTQLAIRTQPSGAVSGLPFSTQPVIELRDVNNQLVSGGNAVTATLIGSGGQLIGTTTVNAVNGLATFTNLGISGPGTYTIQFTSPNLSSVTSSSITVSPAPPTQLAVTTQPGGASSGAPLNPQPVVQVRDQFNQVVAGFNGPVTATLNGANGTLTGTTTVNAVNGVATFSSLAVNSGPGGSFTLTFSSPNLASANSAAFTITPLPGTQLAITTQPGGAVTGSPLNPQPVVEVRNTNNGLVTNSNAQVTAQLLGSGTLSGTTTVTAVNGVATFTNLVVTGISRDSIVFTSSGLTSALSNAFNITVGAPTQLAIQVQPGGGTVGGQINPQPVVEIRDAQGNLVTTANNPVTAALVGTGGTLTGTVTVNAVNGVATFTNLGVSGNAGSYSLNFTSGSLSSIQSAPFTVNQLPPTRLQVTQQPGTTLMLANLAPVLTVEIRNANNGLVTNSSAPVTVTLLPSQGATGTLTGTTTVNAVNGVATFTNLQVNGLGTYNMNINSPGLSGTSINFPFDIIGQLIGSVQNGVATQTLPPATVDLLDANGNVITAFSGPVTVAISGGPGTLSGTTTVNAVNGRATFNNLSVSAAGTYSFTFTSPPNAFFTKSNVVIAQLPTKVGLQTQPGSSAVTGSPLNPQPVATILDANNTVVTTSSAPVTVTLNTLTGGPASLSGTTTVNAVNGVASFTNLVITGSSGSYSLTFSSPNLTPITSNAITLNQQPPSQVVITTQPGSASNSTFPLSPQPVVELRNASNTVVIGSTNPVTATLNTVSGGPGTLSGTTTVNANNGVATFTNLVISGTGTYTITFSSPNLTSATSSQIVVSPPPATQLAVTTQPGGAITGQPLNPQPVVQARDANGNPVTSFTGPVTATLVGTGGSLTGTTTVNAVNGVATFTNLVVNGPGTYQLNFSSPNLTTATSSSFVIQQAFIGFKVGPTATANATIGTNYAVPLILDMSTANGQNIASIQFTFTWDPTKFDYVSDANGTFGGSPFFTVNRNNTSTGSLTIGIADTQNGFNSGTPTIFTVTLLPKASTTGTTLNTNVQAAGDVNGNPLPIPVTPRPQTVTIP